MSLQPVALMDLIINGLSTADPTVNEDLRRIVPYYWNESGELICGYDIRYLMTMRSALIWLMGSVRNQIDVKIGQRNAKSASSRSSRQDSKSMAQAESSSVRWSDSIGTARSRDFDDQYSEGRAHATHTRNAFNDASSYSDDKGVGSGTRKMERGSSGGSNRNSTNNYDSASNTSTSQNMFYYESGSESNSHAGAGVPGWAHTGTTFSGATRGNESGGVNDDTKGEGNGNGVGSLSGSANSSSSGADKSSSSFKANVISHSESAGASQANSDSSTTSHAGSFAESHANGQSRSRSDAASKAHSKAVSQSDGETHSQAVSKANDDESFIKYHQRFLHLVSLYNEIDEKIQHLKRVNAASQPISVGSLTTTLPSWCLSASDPRWNYAN